MSFCRRSKNRMQELSLRWHVWYSVESRTRDHQINQTYLTGNSSCSSRIAPALCRQRVEALRRNYCRKRALPSLLTFSDWLIDDTCDQHARTGVYRKMIAFSLSLNPDFFLRTVKHQDSLLNSRTTHAAVRQSSVKKRTLQEQQWVVFSCA
jgi:hypothetical protein